MHKIHRPTFVDYLWYNQEFWFLPHDTFLRFDAKIELQFPVDPVNTLMIPPIAFVVV